MQLITKEQAENIEDGIDVYQKNAAFKSLANVMEHPEFKLFFDKYFENPSDAETMLMFMKTYQKITETNPEASPYEKLALVKKLMSDKEIRPVIVNEFLNWFGRRTDVNDSATTNRLAVADCIHQSE